MWRHTHYLLVRSDSCAALWEQNFKSSNPMNGSFSRVALSAVAHIRYRLLKSAQL